MKLGWRKLVCLLVDLSLLLAVSPSFNFRPRLVHPCHYIIAAWKDLLPSSKRWWWMMTLAAGTSTGNFRRSRGGIERPFVSLPLLFGLVILLIKHFYFPFPPVFRIFLQFLLSLTLVTHRQPLDPRSLSQNQVHRFRRFWLLCEHRSAERIKRHAVVYSELYSFWITSTGRWEFGPSIRTIFSRGGKILQPRTLSTILWLWRLSVELTKPYYVSFHRRRKSSCLHPRKARIIDIITPPRNWIFIPVKSKL